MAFCPDCEHSRASMGLWRMFNPACLWCGARILQRIPKYSKTPTEASQRRKEALKTWTEYHHSEKDLRALVAGPMAFAPIPKQKEKK